MCTRWLGEVAPGVAPGAPQVIAILTNSAQVLFLSSPWVGVLVVVAVALHSRAAAMWVALASVLAWLTAWVGGLPADSIVMGYLGYNAMILAAALHARQTPIGQCHDQRLAVLALPRVGSHRTVRACPRRSVAHDAVDAVGRIRGIVASAVIALCGGKSPPTRGLALPRRR